MGDGDEEHGIGDKVLGILVIVGLLALAVCSLLSLSGCATLYVSGMRSDYDGERRVIGIYGKGDVYPSCYHATWVVFREELPSWWWPSEYEWGRAYQMSIWPIGAVFSVVDVGISAVTDTVMLPYDAYEACSLKERSE